MLPKDTLINLGNRKGKEVRLIVETENWEKPLSDPGRKKRRPIVHPAPIPTASLQFSHTSTSCRRNGSRTDAAAAAAADQVNARKQAAPNLAAPQQQAHRSMQQRVTHTAQQQRAAHMPCSRGAAAAVRRSAAGGSSAWHERLPGQLEMVAGRPGPGHRAGMQLGLVCLASAARQKAAARPRGTHQCSCMHSRPYMQDLFQVRFEIQVTCNCCCCSMLTPGSC